MLIDGVRLQFSVYYNFISLNANLTHLSHGNTLNN